MAAQRISSMSHRYNSPPRRNDFSVLIICSKDTHEQFLRSLMDQVLGEFPGNLGSHLLGVIAGINVVVVSPAPEQFTPAFVKTLLATFPSIEMSFVLGSCGAIPTDTRIGEDDTGQNCSTSTALIESAPAGYKSESNLQNVDHHPEPDTIVGRFLAQIHRPDGWAWLSKRLVEHHYSLPLRLGNPVSVGKVYLGCHEASDSDHRALVSSRSSEALYGNMAFDRAACAKVLDDVLPTLMIASASYWENSEDGTGLYEEERAAMAVAVLKATLEQLHGLQIDPHSNANEVLQQASQEPTLEDVPQFDTVQSKISLSVHAVKSYTVACIFPTETAYAAGAAMLDERHDNLPFLRDHNVYTLGRMGSHHVVLSALSETGITRATSLVVQLLNDFPSIRFALLVGTAGGIPSPNNDVRLGDVVVSQPTDTFGGSVQYDLGKRLQDKPFRRTGQLSKPGHLLQSAVKKLSAVHDIDGSQVPDILRSAISHKPKGQEAQFQHPPSNSDLLFRSSYIHNEALLADCEACDDSHIIKRKPRFDKSPVIHYGTIASGNTLLRDAQVRDELSRDFNALCVETEAAGIVDEVPTLVIRGISNYADTHKNDVWDAYAAGVAAAYMKELLQVIPAKQVARPQYTVPVLVQDRKCSSASSTSTMVNEPLTVAKAARDPKTLSANEFLTTSTSSSILTADKPTFLKNETTNVGQQGLGLAYA